MRKELQTTQSRAEGDGRRIGRRVCKTWPDTSIPGLTGNPGTTAPKKGLPRQLSTLVGHVGCIFLRR